jgi:hypothetical protein
MNFLQLEKYILDLQESGYGDDTVGLEVELFRKYSVPLFALIMAMIAIPFGFLVGNRGAMTGIGVGIAIALTYLATSKLFEKIGEIKRAVAAHRRVGPGRDLRAGGGVLIADDEELGQGRGAGQAGHAGQAGGRPGAL